MACLGTIICVIGDVIFSKADSSGTGAVNLGYCFTLNLLCVLELLGLDLLFSGEEGMQWQLLFRVPCF